MDKENIDANFLKYSTNFAVELLLKMSDNGCGDKQNIIFSPFSIQSCLAIMYAGTVGETRREIAHIFKYVSNDQNKVADYMGRFSDFHGKCDFAQITNNICIQTGCAMKKEFIALVKSKFNLEEKEIQFTKTESALTTINRWMEESTNRLFAHLLAANDLNNKTHLIFLNTIHFTCDWEKKFLETNTYDGSFWINKTETTNVQMMHQRGQFLYGNFEKFKCSAVELPYKHCALSMFIILPNECDDLKELLSNQLIEFENFRELTTSMSERNVEVIIPKFKVDYSVELSEIFKKMGTKKLFTTDAEFDNLFETKQKLLVTQFLHKATIEVSEQEKSESTDEINLLSEDCISPSIKFQADHPFLYLLWDKKSILFAGSLVTVPN